MCDGNCEQFLFQKSEVVCINNDYNEDEGNISIGSATSGGSGDDEGRGEEQVGELALEQGSPSNKMYYLLCCSRTEIYYL